MAKEQQNKLHTVAELEPSGGTDRALPGQGTQSLHQTCIKTRTYPVNNALAEKRALALDDWARGYKEWDEATKCFGETKDCPLTSFTLVPEQEERTRV